jgi:2-polyprenyl-6-hydroxyphenyl methylase/3-demethylubiquinone-9 3-methyltransferase
MRQFYHKLVQLQVLLCAAFDRLLPPRFTLDGYRDFLNNFAWRYVRSGQLVYDVGGGKNPFFSAAKKVRLGVRVVGLDISPAELAAAPPAAYDEIVCADISQYHGKEEADVVVCAALLEHVKDSEAALVALRSLLKPGGIALLFVPSRNALYARLNLLIPQAAKQKMLFMFFPQTRPYQGFPAYYDRCTPGSLRRLAQVHGFEVVGFKPYYFSSYFSFFFPFYALWRMWIPIF